MNKIAFLGLGAMGSRMAVHFVKAGHEVTVWNRNRDAVESLLNIGAKTAETPALASADREFVISMVRDNNASREIWLDSASGVIQGLHPGCIAIEMSTLTPQWTEELSERINERGARFLDVPVVGSRPQAEQAALIMLAGGEKETIEAALPVLSCLGPAVHHVGPTGSGAQLKLVANSLLGIQVAAIAELLGYIMKQGLDLKQTVKILSSVPVTSPVASALAGLMIDGNFSPRFPVALMEKDLGYMKDCARAIEADLPLTATASGIFTQATRLGLGHLDMTAIARSFLSGVVRD